MKKSTYVSAVAVLFFQMATAQHMHGTSPEQLPLIENVEAQPLLAQSIRLEEALSFLGSSLSKQDADHLQMLKDAPLAPETTMHIQHILDPYCLFMVEINPEARVKVLRGPATPTLMQGGWKSFLVKVYNQARVPARLEVQSPNAEAPFFKSSSQPKMKKENELTPGQVQNRFLDISLYRNRPLQSNLSGLLLEYAVVQIFCKDAGQRQAEIGFNIGQGSQDIGFRNSIDILFNVKPSVKVTLGVKDDDGSPTMASFLITDEIERRIPDTLQNKAFSQWGLSAANLDYAIANVEFGVFSKELQGVYPLPSRRVASFDRYPDFFFQPQVYRTDGEDVALPPGKYSVTCSRGPEYIPQKTSLVVPDGVESLHVDFSLKRWINMAKLGWYSGDHHVHAAGCSHYESPEEGVPPLDMLRQSQGEDLNMATVLTWGPSWYHQKNYFTGDIDTLSTESNIMRYDVEVSGFPSSHSGHVVLLKLNEDDYPGTTTIEEWPSWTLPVLQWAKSQGALTGYAHSGWGLEPITQTAALPNYVTPKMDGIGANEYVVTVTHNAVDFYSAGDTPLDWELNMWYHTLNCGYRTRLSGETDFPCIFDERVGMARSYFQQDGKLDYSGYVDAIKNGRSYVSDGYSHIIDFSVDDSKMGVGKSELLLKVSKTVNVKARVSGYLPEQQTETGVSIAKRKLFEQPYWNIERARIGQTRKIPVELIMNGEVVGKKEIIADGNWNDVNFSLPVKRSGWIALRVPASSHTNPVFVILNGKPIYLKQSAEWCR
ncbi:MAG TPA: CehA/McbA family metallohydrolase, partial [Cyclobacteriaceae bacterium]|nr:CehA/McbA family metallohydrolase [Cyclobacteriaceae bacterium]